jgi:hypothetical protein
MHQYLSRSRMSSGLRVGVVNRTLSARVAVQVRWKIPQNGLRSHGPFIGTSSHGDEWRGSRSDDWHGESEPRSR